MTILIDVGNEDRGQAIKSGARDEFGNQVARMRSFAGTTFDRHLGAVHVHLAIADLVEPCPYQQRLPRRRVRWNFEAIVIDQGAATKHGVNDMISLALVV